ncbi:hypothetical protein CSA56_18525 [candidate division KSB3 bacterium]|uniref:IstB-like ATP-binding domain-containing protein n=1 Tax=candidate division KSB3 bacterium TaxID=2044937 RepID=A0A2G6K6Q1_9BACT|nr:MAG: hypothetical protein CSA56_18525 [candidate division KSB3 bacterium]
MLLFVGIPQPPSPFTSQLTVAHWHEAIGEPTLADAILDRLLHTATKLQIKGEYMRKKQAELDQA